MQPQDEPVVAALAPMVICPTCTAERSASARVCPRCGTHSEQLARNGATDRARHTPTPAPLLLDRPWFVLSMLFLAAMVLGLPFLWKSRAFGRNGKVVITLLVIVQTIVVFWVFGLIMSWVFRTISDSLG